MRRRRLQTTIRGYVRRAGFDVTRWPRRPDDWVMHWSTSQVLQVLDINCVLDVGANRGQFGQLMRQLGFTGRIVSFEPSPTALPSLREAAARDRSWQVRPVGLSREAGVAELNLHVSPAFDSLHAPRPEYATQESYARLPEFRRVDVATITLSTLAIEFPEAVAGIGEPRVLLKSDTQGHDLEVLAGAKGIPAEVRAVLVELSAQAIYEEQPAMTRVMDALFAEGFAPVAFQPVSRSPDKLRTIELDGLFMRPRDGDDNGSALTSPAASRS
jgi:FkbM family methyltransferase